MKHLTLGANVHSAGRFPAPAFPRACSLLVAVLGLFTQAASADAPEVSLVRAPDGGIQPHALRDEGGAVHLIYFKGSASGGDVFYVRRAPGQGEFSSPMRVNSRPGSIIAAGTIRGAQMALGGNGRIHVAWMGSAEAEPAVIDERKTAPMVYTRLRDDRSGFEPERNLLTWAAGLDGGGSVAADARGNVYVAWHGHPPGSADGEGGRAVFVARSRDEGKSFGRETQANTAPTGVCACCGMKAFADRSGRLYLIYRAAAEKINRDMILLASDNQGDSFRSLTLSRRLLDKCPMSSEALLEGPAGLIAAWESESQVQFAVVDPGAVRSLFTVTAPGPGGRRKHPALAQNEQGQTLFAWTEDTAWQKGGSLAWQLYGKDGKPMGEPGRAGGVPVWSFGSAVARPDGGFELYY
jgi:hypothetical protein